MKTVRILKVGSSDTSVFGESVREQIGKTKTIALIVLDDYKDWETDLILEQGMYQYLTNDMYTYKMLQELAENYTPLTWVREELELDITLTVSETLDTYNISVADYNELLSLIDEMP